MNLTSAIWPGWRVWTRDADRHLGPERVRAAADWFQVPTETVAGTTLDSIGHALHGNADPSLPLWPWVVALGSRNRLRRGGLPFCPGCLATDAQPYYRLDWRLAWIVACDLHGTRLLDRCDRCKAIVEPHRSVATMGDLAHCVGCGFDLRACKGYPVDAGAMAFQRLATGVHACGTGSWGDEQIPARQWFSRARSLVVKGICQIDGHGAAELGNRQIGLWLELQGPAEREARLKVLFHLISGSSPPAFRTERKARPTGAARRPPVKNRASGKGLLASRAPVAKARVQEDWARWLRRNRLW